MCATVRGSVLDDGVTNVVHVVVAVDSVAGVAVNGATRLEVGVDVVVPLHDCTGG